MKILIVCKNTPKFIPWDLVGRPKELLIHIITTFVISVSIINIIIHIIIITTFVISVAISFSFLARPQLLMISQHQAQQFTILL